MVMWKEKYKIGVELIDQQHEELFKRVSDFIRSVQSKGEWEDKLVKVKETLVFMQEYVVTHFDDEEIYQQSINYPEYEKHKDIHKKFKSAISDYVKRFEDEGYTEQLIQEFGGKLMAWLIRHVAGDDQKIGDYVRNQGSEVSES